jgi:hypothetical protein
MKKELKQKWIDALRSKDYRQTTNCLRSRSGYCCLGVLCDIVDNTKWCPNGQQGSIYYFDSGYEVAFPEESWLNTIGLPKNDANALAKMNDEDLESFENIADWIEENVFVTSK